jgi:predicted DNA-binding protein (UPF0251 family)
MPPHHKKGRGKPNGQHLAQTAREAEAVSLRLRGYSIEEIAEQLKVSKPTAVRLIDAALGRVSTVEQRDVQKLHEEADARYLAMLNKWWNLALKANNEGIRAAGIVLQVLRDLRKLWSLNLVRSANSDSAMDLIEAITTAWEPINGGSTDNSQPEGGAALPPSLSPGFDLQTWESPPKEAALDDEDELPSPLFDR